MKKLLILLLAGASVLLAIQTHAQGPAQTAQTAQSAQHATLATQVRRLAQPAPDTIAAWPLKVTERYTTNLIFPSPIFKVDIGSGQLLGKKMGKTENVLLLKANARGMESTNVSVYLEDGRFYSFAVSYADTLNSYNYSFFGDGTGGITTGHATGGIGGRPGELGTGGSGRARPIYNGAHIPQETLDSDAMYVATRTQGGGGSRATGRDGGLELKLKSILLKNSLLWLGLAARNRSAFDFQQDGVRLSVQDRRRLKRSAVQSVAVEPLFVRGGDALDGGRRMPMVIALRPFTIARGKRLVLEWREAGAGRLVTVHIRRRTLLKAQRLG